MSRKLVAYFSATGVTRKVAQALAEAVGADVFEIKPAQEYTKEDLDWRDANSRTTKEKDDKSIRPETVGDVDASGYDVVYVGFPIWWYDAPNIVYGFVESHGLEGKKVAAFATSGGSPIGDIGSKLAKACPGAVWGEAVRFPPSPSASELSDWADSV